MVLYDCKILSIRYGQYRHKIQIYLKMFPPIQLFTLAVDIHVFGTKVKPIKAKYRNKNPSRIRW